MTEIEAFIQKPDSKDWEKLKLVNATADFSEPEQKQPDGKNAKGPVSLLIDGTDETAWRADRGVGRRNQPSVAVVQFEPPLDLPPGTQFKLALRTNDMLGCCRISLTTAPQPRGTPGGLCGHPGHADARRAAHARTAGRRVCRLAADRAGPEAVQ